MEAKTLGELVTKALLAERSLDESQKVHDQFNKRQRDQKQGNQSRGGDNLNKRRNVPIQIGNGIGK